MSDREKLSVFHIEIKPLHEEDIDQFDPILTAHIWDRRTGEIVIDEIAAIKKYMRGGKDEEGRTRTYLVAKDQTGKVLGCMAYSIPDTKMIEHFGLENPEDSIELLNAFVSPEVFRGGGVGRKLFDAICEAGRQEAKKQLLIHSGPRYEDSWVFYDRMTDEQKGFIENRYGLGRHAKTWRKAL